MLHCVCRPCFVWLVHLPVHRREVLPSSSRRECGRADMSWRLTSFRHTLCSGTAGPSRGSVLTFLRNHCEYVFSKEAALFHPTSTGGSGFSVSLSTLVIFWVVYSSCPTRCETWRGGAVSGADPRVLTEVCWAPSLPTQPSRLTPCSAYSSVGSPGAPVHATCGPPAGRTWLMQPVLPMCPTNERGPFLPTGVGGSGGHPPGQSLGCHPGLPPLLPLCCLCRSWGILCGEQQLYAFLWCGQDCS